MDAPCSALGLLYRKPDIKFKKREDELFSLADIDREILETASRYVANGGRLIYSTCTIDKMENDGVIDSFLKANAAFKEADILDVAPEGLKDKANGGRVQLFPFRDKVDGFFIAVLERVL